MKKDAAIGNEELLLLALCRLEFSDEQIIKIRSLKSGITDWSYFSTLSNEHGLAALVWHNLEELKLLQGIPEQVLSFLRLTFLQSLGHNTFNTVAIGEVLRKLNEAKIKTVILKGLALENSVYGNSGLRQMSDVDVLINRKDCLKARDILLKDGYISMPAKSVFHEMIMTYSGKHLPSLLKNGTSVEIHQELFGVKESMLTNMLYETSYEVEIKGQKAWFPQPQIFFLYLVKHLWTHEMTNESQLRLYTDLVVMIGKYREEILNSDLLKYASDAKLTDILAWHLEPLRNMMDVSFPDWLNDFIDKHHNQEFCDRFIFFIGSPKNNPPIDKPKFYRYIVSEIPGIHRKVLYVLGDIFPSLKFMKNRYSCKSTWRVLLLYPHRLGKIFWLFGKN